MVAISYSSKCTSVELSRDLTLHLSNISGGSANILTNTLCYGEKQILWKDGMLCASFQLVYGIN